MWYIIFEIKLHINNDAFLSKEPYNFLRMNAKWTIHGNERRAIDE
jgi:hypothetical protein